MKDLFNIVKIDNLNFSEFYLSLIKNILLDSDITKLYPDYWEWFENIVVFGLRNKDDIKIYVVDDAGLAICQLRSDYFKILTLYVMKDKRRIGIGSKLISLIHDDSCKFARITFKPEVEDMLLPFCEKNGFNTCKLNNEKWQGTLFLKPTNYLS